MLCISEDRNYICPLILSKKRRENERKTHLYFKLIFVTTKNSFSTVCGLSDTQMTSLINWAFTFVIGKNEFWNTTRSTVVVQHLFPSFLIQGSSLLTVLFTLFWISEHMIASSWLQAPVLTFSGAKNAHITRTFEKC